MTNADKYLRKNADRKELAEKLFWVVHNNFHESKSIESAILEFFEREAKSN